MLTDDDLHFATETDESAYWAIGNALLTNARSLHLDEDITNLMCFAVGVAEKLSPFLQEGASRIERGRAWDRRPLQFKMHGHSAADSDVRTDAKASIGMAGALLFNLKREPIYSDAADALFAFEARNHLWTDEDEVME